MPDFSQIWTEKYRPQELSEIIGQEEIVKRLKVFAKEKSIPHLLFSGRPGVGKTTAAICIARELFGDNWRQNFLETNASDERGIDVVRSKIKDFARTRPIGSGFKIIFLDECDALTKDAQNALRRTMENYSSTCRFILSCNYSSKIIDPIQSRCAIFRFGNLKKEDIKKYVENIAKEEGLTLDSTALESLLVNAEGDLRRVTNFLQTAATMGKSITEKHILTAAATAEPKEMLKVLELAVEGNFEKSREELVKIMSENGLSGEDALKQMHRYVPKLKISDAQKWKILDKMGECAFRVLEGSNERIQLEAFLAYVALVCAP